MKANKYLKQEAETRFTKLFVIEYSVYQNYLEKETKYFLLCFIPNYYILCIIWSLSYIY